MVPIDLHMNNFRVMDSSHE